MILRLLLILAFASSALYAQEDGQDWDVRLTQVSGEVMVFVSGEDAEGIPAAADMPLQEGDRVVTGEGASAEISLGGEHVISLRERSDFTLVSPRRSQTLLSLALGTLLGKLQALAAGQALSVRTPTAVASVRGTEFGVEFDSDAGQTYVAVFDEGEVAVQSEAGGQIETLRSNQETRVARAQPPLPAYHLRRLRPRREYMRHQLRPRLATLRRGWRQLPPAERMRLRRETIDRMKQKRREQFEQRRQMKDRRPLPPVRRKPRPDQEKMEKFREEIMRRRRQQKQ
ncbi:MAG: FecR domain-containing protein [Elusimicrobia bacterium]|nr:FecR domain-containing protein [Elusimicrobiota bacterium]